MTFPTMNLALNDRAVLGSGYLDMLLVVCDQRGFLLLCILLRGENPEYERGKKVIFNKVIFLFLGHFLVSILILKLSLKVGIIKMLEGTLVSLKSQVQKKMEYQHSFIIMAVFVFCLFIIVMTNTHHKISHCKHAGQCSEVCPHCCAPSPHHLRTFSSS